MSSSVLLTVEAEMRPLVDRSLRRRLKRRCLRMLKGLGLESAELSVLLAGDPTVARLNETYRSKRGTTDVLSFAQAPPELIEQWTTAPVDPDGPERVLGDLVISLQVVQKRSGGDAFEPDLVTLLAHGLLHLTGHEHANATDRKQMLALQDQLARIGTSRGRVTPLS